MFSEMARDDLLEKVTFEEFCEGRERMSYATSGIHGKGPVYQQKARKV